MDSKLGGWPFAFCISCFLHALCILACVGRLSVVNPAVHNGPMVVKLYSLPSAQQKIGVERSVIPEPPVRQRQTQVLPQPVTPKQQLLKTVTKKARPVVKKKISSTAPPVSKTKTPEVRETVRRTDGRAENIEPIAAGSASAGSTVAKTNGTLAASGPVSGKTETGRGGIVELGALKISKRVKPVYPAIARRRREEGTVTLLLSINGSDVTKVTVERSSGVSTLDEAASDAVKRWKFDNGALITARIPITFRLTK